MNNTVTGLSWLSHQYTLTTNQADLDHLKFAYSLAQDISRDPSTKNGALLVDTKSIIGHGVNAFPAGIDNTNERWNDRATKYRLVVHAEMNAILFAARKGRKTQDSVLYCPFYACSECAKNIIAAGVKRIVGHAQLMMEAGKHDGWIKSVSDGWEMLTEASIECSLYDGVVGITTRFNYQDIQL